jgi:hypothetical protein
MLLYVETNCCKIYRFRTCQTVWILKIRVIVCVYKLEFQVFLCAVHFHPTFVRTEKRRFQRFVEMSREEGLHNRSVMI